MERLACALTEIAQADYCHLRLVSNDGGRLDLRAAFPPGDDAPTAPARSLAKGEGLAGRVWERGTAMSHPDPSGQGLEALDPGESQFSVPIRFEEGVLGTVTLGSRFPGAFPQDVQQVVETMIEAVPPAIELALAREKLKLLATVGSECHSLEHFAKELANVTQVVTKAQIAVVWVLDRARNGFRPVATAFAGQELSLIHI